jgi:hypothetical protein
VGLDCRRDTHAALSDFERPAGGCRRDRGCRGSDGGEAQFTEEALPGFLADSLLPLEALRSLFSVGWQLDGLADGVHEPTQRTWVEVQDPSFTSLDSERAP